MFGIRFSRVTYKTAWMKRTVDNITLPVFLSTVEGLLCNNNSSNFCFMQALEIDSINSETNNIHYTAHQFWEQDGPRGVLMEIVKDFL